MLKNLKKIYDSIKLTADYINLEKEKLTKKGAWKGDTDPRFAPEKEEFNILYSKIKEVK